MLDKSIEFHSIIMRHPNDREPVPPLIPQGFSIRFYEKGYEQDWADIWSYKAIGIYMDIGFAPMKTATYSEVSNEYEEALRVIRGKNG